MSRTVRRLAVASLLALAAVIVPAATASADDHAPETVTTDVGWGSASTTAPATASTQGDVGWGSTEANTPATALTQGDVGWG
ncbi:hypothetical protein [Streptomyces sp. NPDC057617]|uniref:hypothetical protein n=1 Tax=Streptomyces sp. NPDC057617 TaxID=3346184 RepID=UPI00368C6B3E